MNGLEVHSRFNALYGLEEGEEAIDLNVGPEPNLEKTTTTKEAHIKEKKGSHAGDIMGILSDLNEVDTSMRNISSNGTNEINVDTRSKKGGNEEEGASSSS